MLNDPESGNAYIALIKTNIQSLNSENDLNLHLRKNDLLEIIDSIKFMPKVYLLNWIIINGNKNESKKSETKIEQMCTCYT